MKSLIIAALMLASSSAFADGWVCYTESGLVAQAFNKTNPREGTRSPAVLVISDRAVGAGNKTIAKFTDAEGLLEAEGASYTGKVDLRYNNTGRKGELIAGTKLGYVDTINLWVDFSYGAPVRHGDEVEGALIIIKRNGEEIIDSAVCQRYLKN